MRSLLIHVNLLHPLWHGSGDWPPSPFRLFQAMVAGAFAGRWAAEDEKAQEERLEAFQWLERQAPPDIVAPPKAQCRRVTSYVPNNDLDAVGGDPRRVEDIRAEKTIAPIRLEHSQTFLYAWHFDTGEAEAKALCGLAERLHTFGRGVDPAWAKAEVLERGAAEAILVAHGAVARPAGALGGNLLPCPTEGSLQSLMARHLATTQRLVRDAKNKRIWFRQPPKAHYQQIGYDRKPVRFTFEIRQSANLTQFAPIRQVRASVLTEALRDQAASRLTGAWPEYEAPIQRFLAGKGAGPADRDRRVRIIPIPTIGHPDASPSIRRVAVEIPVECPLKAEDVRWAFLGLQVTEEERFRSVCASPAVLAPAQSDEMLRHYAWDEEFTRWRSVTPVALPTAPGRVRTGVERSLSEAQSAGALVNAVRHAGVTTPVTAVRIQREPFHARGAMADAFESSRFAGRLRHVEVLFQSPVRGPLILGDGRFLGLGLMRPVKEPPGGLHVFSLNREISPSARMDVIRAMRRAVMARAQTLFGRESLPVLFHGHEEDGAPARQGNHKHIFLAAFGSDEGAKVNRIAVMAPGLCDRSVASRQHWDELAQALDGLRVLRCGRAGVFTLTPGDAEEDLRFFGSGRVWTTVTPYRPTRHPGREEPDASWLERDLRVECARRSLPAPKSVDLVRMSRGPRGGLSASIRMEFSKPVRGPVLLGRGSHLGDGLFGLM